MKKLIYLHSKILLFFLITGLQTLNAQMVIQNYLGRDRATLNGKWQYIIDPYEIGFYNSHLEQRDKSPDPGFNAIFTNDTPKKKSDRREYNFETSPTLLVPGDWNTQDEVLKYYEGTIWYKKSFDYKKQKTDNRLFLNFTAVNYRADVYLNGKKLGVHEGGFTPFYFEITDKVKPTGNFVVLKVDNTRKREAVPTKNTDWWNYGGITRDVDIIETPAIFVKDYLVQLNKDNNKIISGFVQLDGKNTAQKEVTISIPELKINTKVQTDNSGQAKFDIKAKKINYWSPTNPKLYTVTISSGSDDISDKIGFRTIKIDGQNILLNGASIFLRGVCMHEENPLRGGRAYCREDAVTMLKWAKEMNCNYMRLAHYPHNEYVSRLADEMGILLWEENPVYWSVMFENKETYKTAERQLRELIIRDKNRASVIIWSMANETPQTEARLEFLKKLANVARELDGSRLISAALLQTIAGKGGVEFAIDDPFAEFVDIISFNQYVGWYFGLPDKCNEVEWSIPLSKPVIISEFGGGALQGFHGDSITRWSEEYQEDLYKKNLRMIQNIEQLRGTTPWILADFRSPNRQLPHIQDGWNRKGLISEHGIKKKAFYVMQAFYEEIKNKWEGNRK